MNKLFFLLFFIFLGCNDSNKTGKEINKIEWNINENYNYRKFGKLKLSEYNFFIGKLKNLIPGDNVLPYSLISPFFSDYTEKKRFIYLPNDSIIRYNQTEILEFPLGSIIIKNFIYPKSLTPYESDIIVETRLLINNEDGWKALPYIWNEEQSEAFLDISGRERSLTLNVHGTFNYIIPSMVQCKSCHEKNGKIYPIGPTARQLNSKYNYSEGEKNQLEKLREISWIDSLPENIPQIVDYMNSLVNIDKRARAYLDINCSYCHREVGSAKNAGLDLTLDSKNDFTLGLYKSPVAAGKGSGGLLYDIYPGNPDKSILVYRMESKDHSIMMPEVGRRLIHLEGIELIKKWIESLE